MSDEQARLKYGQGMFQISSKSERPAKLRWYTNPPALLITYGSVSGNEKLVNTIRRAQSPKIAMDCGRDWERCSSGPRYNPTDSDGQNSLLQLLSSFLRLPATGLHGYRTSIRATLVAFPYIVDFFDIHSRFKTWATRASFPITYRYNQACYGDGSSE